jgi:integral membrane protein (TIGR01906 family)
MKQRILAITQAVLIALVVLSGSIALPLLFRPFFYWHIGPLRLPELVELTVPEIKTAYNEVMNYCIGLTDTFSAGSLPFSDAGAEHFADVQKLFVLDLRALVASAILLIGIRIAFQKGKLRLLDHTPGFWGAVGLGFGISAVGALAALDFNKAFMVFHKLFFPGKDNWLFDPRTDPIILMLPAGFFRNCAILIFATILLSCTGLLLWDWRVRHKK